MYGETKVSNSGVILGDVTVNGPFSSRDGVVVGDISTSSLNDRIDLNGARVAGDVSAGHGNDVIDVRGAQIAGVVSGGAGNDRFIVDDTSPAGVGDTGRDAVWYYGPDYDLPDGIEDLRMMTPEPKLGLPWVFGRGNDTDNKIVGSSGNDLLWDRAGNDKVYGADGHDQLEDGDGRDQLFGGAGYDEFLFTNDGETDRIKDYEPGTDLITLVGWGLPYSDKNLLEITDLSHNAFEIRWEDEHIIVESDAAVPDHETVLWLLHII